MSSLTELIKPEFLVLIPVIYYLGTLLKQADCINNCLIPIMLGLTSIMLTTIGVFSGLIVYSVPSVLQALFASITQGILVAAASVYFNQLYVKGKEIAASRHKK